MKRPHWFPSRRRLTVYAAGSIAGVIAVAGLAAIEDRLDETPRAGFQMVRGGIATSWVELRGLAMTVYLKRSLEQSSAPASIPSLPVSLHENDDFVQLNGWPLRALDARFGLINQNTGTAGGIGLGHGRDFVWSEGAQGIAARAFTYHIPDAPSTLLPYGVLWAGFLGDAAIYWGLLVVGHAIALGVPTALVGRIRRARGQCGQCGYDLSGSPGGACSECGKAGTA